MGKLASTIVLIGLGVLLALAAGVLYAVYLLGAERLNLYVMVLLIILGVAVFMRGLRWIIEGRHLHEHKPVERETVREIHHYDGRLPHSPNIHVLPQQSAMLGQIYPDMARAAMQGMAQPSLIEAPQAPAAPAANAGQANVWDAVGSLVESDQWAY
jgi:hypothetical protein